MEFDTVDVIDIGWSNNTGSSGASAGVDSISAELQRKRNELNSLLKLREQWLSATSFAVRAKLPQLMKLTFPAREITSGTGPWASARSLLNSNSFWNWEPWSSRLSISSNQGPLNEAFYPQLKAKEKEKLASAVAGMYEGKNVHQDWRTASAIIANDIRIDLKQREVDELQAKMEDILFEDTPSTGNGGSNSGGSGSGQTPTDTGNGGSNDGEDNSQLPDASDQVKTAGFSTGKLLGWVAGGAVSVKLLQLLSKKKKNNTPKAKGMNSPKTVVVRL